MPTLRTVTVKSAAGDYSSLSAAEAGEQGDLVSLDRQLDIECYAFADTTLVTIDGWTTDSTRYIRVVAPAGQRHSGVWSTSAYRLYPSGATFSAQIYVNEDYTRLEWLQIRNDSDFNRGVTLAASSCTFQGLLIILPAAVNGYGGIVSSAGGMVRNSILIGPGSGQNGTSGIDCDNCTAVGWNIGYQNGVQRNCYAGNNAADYSGGTLTTCASADASGTGGLTGIAYSTANFVSVTGGSEDLHLVSGSALRNVATDLSGTFTLDIDGDTRSAWDIGADEFDAGGGAAYTLTADSGSVLLTGTAASLKYGRRLSAAAGSIALTGTAANLLRGLKLLANSGGYTLTGTAAALLKGSRLSAAGGSVLITGTAVDLRRGFGIAANSGSFTISGQAASLLATRLLQAGAGSVVITGTAATLTLQAGMSVGGEPVLIFRKAPGITSRRVLD